ncbi:MAG TPA: autotransporter-associated beta strand repeat-containing protein, partial [Roseimicrobium sp.]|nr:autotransporter-associated beta strand repeat-containing protein [Roseimicrobium sp.]
MNFRLPLAAWLLLIASEQSGFGIVTINNDSAALNAPSSGAPWDYVARLDNGFGARASGVYLGNRYILTANHVDNDINVIHLDNTDFTLDGSFTPMAIQGTDMRILRLAQDPGLPLLPLITSSQSAFNQAATMIGWGVGKGTPVANQGWNWADDTTRLERWGTSTTLGTYATDSTSGITYLVTTFDPTKGAATGQLTGGDSGGGLFINYGGVWTLVGVNADVDTGGQALYDHDLTTAGNQPDRSYFASLAQFTSQIQAIVGATPLGGLLQYWDGSGLAANGVINGGTGTWNATLTNWANSTGTINAKWQGGTAIFSGPAGTITLNSAISAQALTFNTSGYTIAGTSILTLAGTAPEIDVTNAGDSAMISAPLAGTKGLKVGGAGTLILTSATNSYTGGTAVSVGTLQIGTATVAGKINAASAVTLGQGGMLSLVNVSSNTFANNVSTGTGGGTLNIASSNTNTLTGALTDNGTNLLGVTQSGSGVTILKNTQNTYSGATTVAAGTLQIGIATAAGAIGGNSSVSLLNSSTLSLVNVSGNTLANNIDHSSSGSGLVNVNASVGVTLSGTISNSGGLLALTKSGTGTLVISNPGNTYSGDTTLNTGTLIVNGNTSDGSGTPLGTGTLIVKGGTLGTTVQTSTAGGTILTNPISLLGNFSISTNSNPTSLGAQNFTLNGNIGLNG